MNKTISIVLMALAVPALAAVTTKMNMQTAFNSELNTEVRYKAFATKADIEGYPGVAGVFRAVAFSESIHAANHAKALKALGGDPVEVLKVFEAKTTKTDLEAALKAEMNESGQVYPAFVKQAVKEGNAQAIISLKGAMASEGGHARIFTKLLKAAADWKSKIAIIVCKTCGYSTEDLNIKLCPFCKHPRGEFLEM